MLTEELHSAGVEAGTKVAQHEDAAHEKRNWVRLTFDCNNRCIFCLDSDTHDGEMRDADEVKTQILEGRRKGATRLILSGGEPTMHPKYVDFIKLGRAAGYRKIQTVTNGRMFQYPEFLDRCLTAGLSEITFSLHGPNARIHDALVGVKGAFEQETAGLRRAIAARDRSPYGLPVINVDIVINRANVKHLRAMLDLFIGWGVKEFDLLQVVPFGRAFTDGRDTLFYDLEEMRPHLLEAFELCHRPDLHIWLNRFPPPHLEGFEHLIQDPYKLNDEVRGRKEEFARLLDQGEPLDCHDPGGRCSYCYLEKLCGSLDVERARLERAEYGGVRVDARSVAARPPVFGGDPASARRARGEPDPGAAPTDGRRRLPLVGGARPTPNARTVAESLAVPVWIVAADRASAEAQLAGFPAATAVELELDDPTTVHDATLGGLPIVRAHATTEAAAAHLLALPGSFEVLVHLSTETAPYLRSITAPPARLAVLVPTHERLTESATEDVELPPFFEGFSPDVPVYGAPRCIVGDRARDRGPVLDLAIANEDGRVDMFAYTGRYVADRYMTKSLRCRPCVHADRCQGLHVNYVRAHGYAAMVPILAGESAPA